jgi:hypothetical protein
VETKKAVASERTGAARLLTMFSSIIRGAYLESELQMLLESHCVPNFLQGASGCKLNAQNEIGRNLISFSLKNPVLTEFKKTTITPPFFKKGSKCSLI